jgi:hypothetical protein
VRSEARDREGQRCEKPAEHAPRHRRSNVSNATELREVSIDGDSDDERHRTESQDEWANWAAHGYRKLDQPRSVLRFGFLFSVVLGGLLFAVFWFAAQGGLPW